MKPEDEAASAAATAGNSPAIATKTSTSVAALLSIDDIDAVALGATPHEFEYVLPDGRATGVFVSVYGSQCELVQTAINAAINERRKKEAEEDAAKEAGGRPGIDYQPIEPEIEFGKRLTAIRVASWRGLKDAFTPENALRLVKVNQDLATQVLNRANNLSLFMKVSLPA